MTERILEPEALSREQLSGAVLAVLQSKPNNSCKRAALPSLVVKALGLRKVRGKRRAALKRRLNAAIRVLADDSTPPLISEYRAKNARLRLVGGNREPPQIQLPSPLPAHIRRAVDEYYKGNDPPDDSSLALLRTHLHRRIDLMQNSRTAWVQQLSTYVWSLQRVMDDHLAGHTYLSPNVEQAIRKTLQYVATRDDVIPDHTPGIGLLDDAYVVNSCVRLLGRVHTSICHSYFSEMS